MFIPLGTDRPLARPRLITPWLIGLNVLFFLISAVFNSPRGNPVVDPLLLDPDRFRIWQPITHAFLHADFLHILGNMLVLWTFGPNVEDRLGRVKFTVFYIAGGFAAAGLQMLLSPGPMLGASGAVAAITGAYLVLFPRTHIKMLVWFFIIGIFAIPAWWFIAFAVAKDIFLTSSGKAGNVATWAHLGGYAFGIATSLILLASHQLEREPYDLFSMARQANRRRAFREAAHALHTAERHRPTAAAAPIDASSPLAAARLNIAELLARDQTDQAAAAYQSALTLAQQQDEPLVLSKSAQLKVANALFAAGLHGPAATAYSDFTRVYKDDPEAPRASVMAALLYIRYLNRPELAAPLLPDPAAIPDPAIRDLIRQLLTERAATPHAAPAPATPLAPTGDSPLNPSATRA